MKYLISYNSPEKHYIDFELLIENIDKDNIELQLPSWRPGRYELGNFAKNIKDFIVLDSSDTKLKFKKLSKDRWEIDTKGKNSAVIKYKYYAAELNAGSTYLDESQLYINPVNCTLSLIGSENSSYELEFDLPEKFELYSSLEKKEFNKLFAENFEELVDSPIIASESVQSRMLKISEVDFHFCFQGEITINWEQLLDDFKKFISFQINQFSSFPHSSFHFLFQITPYNAYHGVEHHKSTVILLGPTYEVFGSLYKELLGVSSHELYHVWNVKGIRPFDMLPYDYAKENYTELGYVTEGVTTYMGDRILFESGVFTKEAYFSELKTLLLRHFHNDGRLHYSVAASSWDTWLDGYGLGAPGRKVSIYVEGALIAFICDSKIRKATSHKKSLHDVMKELSIADGDVKGYDFHSYKNIIEEISGIDFTSIFDNIIYGSQDFSPYLKDAFEVFGWCYEIVPSKKISWNYGLKTVVENNEIKVIRVLENSAACDSGLVVEDKLIAVNGYVLKDNLDKWMGNFKNKVIRLAIERRGKLKEIDLKDTNDFQYFDYQISPL